MPHRMKPGAAPGIAEVFADSDRGELPHLIGVSGRSLFQFGDVYLHLIEADEPPGPRVAAGAEAPIRHRKHRPNQGSSSPPRAAS